MRKTIFCYVVGTFCETDTTRMRVARPLNEQKY